MSEKHCNGSGHMTWKSFFGILTLMITLSVTVWAVNWNQISKAQEQGQENSVKISSLQADNITTKESVKRIESTVTDMNRTLNNFILEVKPVLLKNPNKQ